MTPPYVLEASPPENGIELSHRESELSASSVVAAAAATGLESNHTYILSDLDITCNKL